MMLVKATEPCYRPMFIVDGHKEIKSFAFHDGKGVLFTVPRGFIECTYTVETPSGRAVERRVDLDNFIVEDIRMARTVNYAKRDHFYYKGVLYLCVVGEEDDTANNDVYVYSVQRDVEESMGNSQVYYYDHYKVAFKQDTGSQPVVTIKVFNRAEQTDFGKLVDKVSTALSNKKANIDKYTIGIMLENNLLNVEEILK